MCATVLLAGSSFVACDDQPDKFEMTDGVPTVKYVRVTDPNKADSLLTGAFLQNTICLVGDNLRSIHEMYFNDQKAILNTSLITDHTLIVSIPKNIPTTVTDKIYMITRDGETVEYDFNVKVPNPVVSSMNNEWAKAGSEAVLYGQYFVDDANNPIQIIMPGNIPVPHDNIVSVTQNEVRFVVPQEASDATGQIDVRTMYGLGRSAFHFHDVRGMMFDFDDLSPLRTVGQGWADVPAIEDEYSLCGNYVQLGDGQTEISDEDSWKDKLYFLEYWAGTWGQGFPSYGQGMLLSDLVDFSDWQNMSIKFEMSIPKSNPWKSIDMQVLFASPEQLSLDNASWNFFHGGDLTGDEKAKAMSPRAIYRPWLNSGSYDTNDEWVTVTIPLASFIYDYEAKPTANPITDTSYFGSFQLCICGTGGLKSERPCSPIVRIDNIRAVQNL